MAKIATTQQLLDWENDLKSLSSARRTQAIKNIRMYLSFGAAPAGHRARLWRAIEVSLLSDEAISSHALDSDVLGGLLPPERNGTPAYAIFGGANHKDGQLFEIALAKRLATVISHSYDYRVVGLACNALLAMQERHGPGAVSDIANGAWLNGHDDHVMHGLARAYASGNIPDKKKAEALVVLAKILPREKDVTVKPEQGGGSGNVTALAMDILQDSAVHQAGLTMPQKLKIIDCIIGGIDYRDNEDPKSSAPLHYRKRDMQFGFRGLANRLMKSHRDSGKQLEKIADFAARVRKESHSSGKTQRLLKCLDNLIGGEAGRPLTAARNNVAPPAQP